MALEIEAENLPVHNRSWSCKPWPPSGFQRCVKTGTTVVFDFAPEGERTRVTPTQTGWRQGKEWDCAYEYLASGNAQLLEHLYVRFAARSSGNSQIYW